MDTWDIPEDLKKEINPEIAKFYFEQGNVQLEYIYSSLQRLRERFYTLLNICIIITTALIGAIISSKVLFIQYSLISLLAIYCIIIYLIFKQLNVWFSFHPGIAPKDRFTHEVFNYIRKDGAIKVLKLNLFEIYSIQYKLNYTAKIYAQKMRSFENILKIIYFTIVLAFFVLILYVALDLRAVG